MALVTTTEMFAKAYEGGYAIGAFNVNNMEIIQGITEAAKECNAPVILQVSAGARKYAKQAYLLALVGGVDRYFWYEFQAVEQDDVDREHHFGMVHRDLSPKTGYLAMKTLTKMRPDGSVQNPGWLKDDFCQVSWKRPDGKTVTAVWLPGSEGERTVTLNSPVESACDCFGKPVSVPAPEGTAYKLKLSPKVLYLVTP